MQLFYKQDHHHRQKKVINKTCGVPQRWMLDPTLWNMTKFSEQKSYNNVITMYRVKDIKQIVYYGEV